MEKYSIGNTVNDTIIAAYRDSGNYIYDEHCIMYKLLNHYVMHLKLI